MIRRSNATQRGAEHVVAVVVEGDTADTEMIEAAITNELSLYPPMRAVIERDWARERRQDLLAVEITALVGRRPDGIWSRPDITTVEVRTFEFVPGKHLDVNTFEIKSHNAVNVQAVYEAVATDAPRPGPTYCSTFRRSGLRHSRTTSTTSQRWHEPTASE